ncbi:MAG: redox-sensing transcriptional repressor Rex [Ruminococcaceae bacterium]|nr:redox-sensing transcriptional repressor Rex [Oscillospiraceae bacterium]
MTNRQVPLVVIKRLPRYHRYLGELLDNRIYRVSSTELSEKMGVTASQIRQDLNYFGGFGQQGYGYNVQMLYDAITALLGLNKGYKTVIIGAGNLGRALANYAGFSKRGFSLIGIFDTNPALIGKEVSGQIIKHYDDAKDFIKAEKPDIAILAVPKVTVNRVAEDMVSYGIKALWNFAHVDLDLPGDVIIENVHLSDSLMTLSYRMSEFGERK